jgi:hypothetical protein
MGKFGVGAAAFTVFEWPVLKDPLDRKGHKVIMRYPAARGQKQALNVAKTLP